MEIKITEDLETEQSTISSLSAVFDRLVSNYTNGA